MEVCQVINSLLEGGKGDVLKAGSSKKEAYCPELCTLSP